MMSCYNERLLEEFELLQNVYTTDEVQLCDGNEGLTRVVMTVHPATAGEAHRQYVCLMLHIKLPAEYPDESPLIEIRNPRGLSEGEVVSLEEALQRYITEEKGNPVLLQIFELTRDTLTNTNIPHGVCSICLNDFMDEDMAFLKTECYHYFHVRCIAKYKRHWLSNTEDVPQHLPAYQQVPKLQFVCPECRKPIQVSDNDLVEGDAEQAFVYQPSEKMRVLQKEWQHRYERQLAAGGIIDLEKEREKHRLPPQPVADVEGTAAATEQSTCIQPSDLSLNSLAVDSQNDSTAQPNNQTKIQSDGAVSPRPNISSKSVGAQAHDYNYRHHYHNHRHPLDHHRGNSGHHRYHDGGYKIRHSRPPSGDNFRYQQHRRNEQQHQSNRTNVTKSVPDKTYQKDVRNAKQHTDTSPTVSGEVSNKQNETDFSGGQIPVQKIAEKSKPTEHHRGRYSRPHYSGRKSTTEENGAESAQNKDIQSDNNAGLAGSHSSYTRDGGSRSRRRNNFHRPHKSGRGRGVNNEQNDYKFGADDNARTSSDAQERVDSNPTLLTDEEKQIYPQISLSSATTQGNCFGASAYVSGGESRQGGRGWRPPRGSHRAYWRGSRRGTARSHQQDRDTVTTNNLPANTVTNT